MLRTGRGSITRRLVLVLTLGVTLFWCVAAAGASYVFYRELVETFDRALRQTAERILPLAVNDLRHTNGVPNSGLGSLGANHLEYVIYEVFAPDGRLLLASSDIGEEDAEAFSKAPVAGFRTVGDYRFYAEADPASGIRIAVAEITAHRWEAISDSTKSLFWPLVLLIPLSALAIWLVVRGAMRPIYRLRDEIATRDRTNLTPIDATEQPVELKPIAEAVAHLVARLKVALDAERAFAANSAHELRTPIAGALAQTQRLLAETETGPAHARAGEIEMALKRLSRLSEKLLQLSRVDAGIAVSDHDNELGPVLDFVVKDFRAALADPERLKYSRPRAARLVAPMDMDAFAIAMRNLVDNAIKHGAPEGPIRIEIEPGCIVRVANDGAVIPAATLKDLRRRFTRGATQSQGAGLGLSIVEAIAVQSGGRLELNSPAQGQANGFEARFFLPTR